jgi:MFS family permease
MGEADRQGSARYRDVFGVAEFRALFAAQLVSVAGDQLARLALSILVFDRTHSPAWTALTFAMTFLPDLIGGPLLSGIADRRPRRQVMVTIDVIRTVLVAGLVPAGSPLWLVGVLVAVIQVPNTAWNAGRTALLPQILAGDRFALGQGLFQMTTQTAQLVGFAVGGLAVAGLGPYGALAVDAATFAISALVVRFGVRHRPAPSHPTDSADARERPSWWRQLIAGVATVWGTLRLRALVALACVSGIYIAAEALAAPYAAAIGGGAVAAGLLFATNPLGMVVGMLIVNRLPCARRSRWMVPMAVLSCAPLMGCVWPLDLVATIVLWTISGLASAYNITAGVTFVRSVPDAGRGQAFGLAQTSIRVSQGLGVILAGLAAEVVAVHDVVAAAGLLGSLAAVGAGWWWHKATRPATTVRPA